MKKLTGMFAAIAAVAFLMVGPAHAGSVGAMTTFTDGTAAKADEVNGNFNAVKSAVDENAVDIAGKQNRVVGTCAAGSSIRVIDVNGSVTCEVDNDATYSAGTGMQLNGTQFKPANGSASIPAHMFESKIESYSQHINCVYVQTLGGSYGYFIGAVSATSCDLVAGIQLPDHVTLTGLHCTVYDNSGIEPENELSGGLYRINLVSGIADTVFFTPGSVDSISVQTVSDTTPVAEYAAVDNAAYAYYVGISYSTDEFSSMGSSARVYGCSVSYTY